MKFPTCIFASACCWCYWMILLGWAQKVDATATTTPDFSPKSLLDHTRRFLNFSNLFGSGTRSPTPYDRILGHPVFQVTTSYGSPYLNLEQNPPPDDTRDKPLGPNAKRDDTVDNESRTSIAVYYMDPDEAIHVRNDMKQIQSMVNADIRLASCSLGKALRQSSTTGHGIPTGQQIDKKDGLLKRSDGAYLKFKIKPSVRQLYYARRCYGKERVGLFGNAGRGSSSAESVMLELQGKEEEGSSSKSNQDKTPIQIENRHMRGHQGIPVFYCPMMQKRNPKLKHLISGTRYQIPLFFDYEDMMAAWAKLRKQNPKQKIPEQPGGVEVFNMWDILTSIDREQYKNRKASKDPITYITKPFKDRFGKQVAPGLESITFIPSSRCIARKEDISAKGNGKARLRPMR